MLNQNAKKDQVSIQKMLVEDRLVTKSPTEGKVEFKTFYGISRKT